MKDPYDELRRNLEESVLHGPGETAPDLRQAIAAGKDVPPELRALVDKIERHAHRVSDEEIAALKNRYTEDELFEIIVSAALGSSLRRLRAGLGALEEA